MRIGSGISSPFAPLGNPAPFHRSYVKRNASSNVGPEPEAMDQHRAHFAAGREVVHGPVVPAVLDRPDDLRVLLRRMSGGRELHHRAADVGRIAGIEHQRRREDRDVVPEHRGDLVRVGRAPHVAQQRQPIRRRAERLVDARLLTHRVCEQARPQLRLERLSERVVLPERERHHEFAQAERRIRMGCSPDAVAMADGTR